jgi:hypothetical protein
LQLTARVLARAVRNVPTAPQFWTGYMLALERDMRAANEIDAVWARAITAYTRPEHGVRLWLDYIALVRRRLIRQHSGDGVFDEE